MPATLEPEINAAQPMTGEDDLIRVARSILDDFGGDASAFFRASKPTAATDAAEIENERKEATAVRQTLKLRR